MGEGWLLLVGKHKGMLLVRPRHRWEDNIKMNFKEVMM
jgi:hypothetical protein